jgi:hypothetical protein
MTSRDAADWRVALLRLALISTITVPSRDSSPGVASAMSGRQPSSDAGCRSTCAPECLSRSATSSSRASASSAVVPQLR